MVVHAPDSRVVNQMRKELVERIFQNIIIVRQKFDGFPARSRQVGILVHVFEGGFYAAQLRVFRQPVADDEQEEQKAYLRRKVFVAAQSVEVEIRAERLKRYVFGEMVPAYGKKMIVEYIEIHSRIFPEHRMHQLPDVEVYGMPVGKIVDGSVHKHAFAYAGAEVFILASLYGVGNQVAYHQQLIVPGKINVRQKIHYRFTFNPVLDAAAGEIVAFRRSFSFNNKTCREMFSVVSGCFRAVFGLLSSVAPFVSLFLRTFARLLNEKWKYLLL
jgi:hypothetical protein